MEKLNTNNKIKFDIDKRFNERVLTLHKPLLCSDDNKEYIRELLDIANGKATDRILYFSDIINFIKNVTNKLSHYLTKKEQNNIVLNLSNYNRKDFPKSYKYKPQETTAKFMVKNGKVYLMELKREFVTYENRAVIELTDDTKEIIQSALMNSFIYSR